jgi:large subunit ribosomal protein L14
MIQTQTLLHVTDNSGAKKIMCIRVLGKNKKYAYIGDTIIAVVKVASPNTAYKKSTIVRAVIVRTKNTIRRKDGSNLRFYENAAVIIGIDKNPKATRIFGPIPYELREKKFFKIVSLANYIV